jgi:hypothetical protein
MVRPLALLGLAWAVSLFIGVEGAAAWRKMMLLRQIDVVPAQIAGFRSGTAGGGGDPPAAALHVSETVIQDLPARRRLPVAASQCTE